MNWLESLSPRDRNALLAGAAALLVALLYLGLWEPLANHEARLAERVAQQREQLAWMQTAAAEARQLRGRGGASAAPSAGGSLLSTIDQAAAAAGLKETVKRVAPEGGGTVRVWLGEAPYPAVLRWLQALARQGILPQAVQMERVEVPGRVDARVLLAGAG